MDYNIPILEKVKLRTTTLEKLKTEQNVIDYGAIIICRHGKATMRIDFKEWLLHEGAVITLFPNDVVALTDVSSDFEVEMLQYNQELLREASLQLEQTVYSTLRNDRCRKDNPVLTSIIDGMFNLLRIYFVQKECSCLDQLVLFQLKAFFLGFYDYINRNKNEQPNDTGSRRTNELFNLFMETLEHGYRESHDVAYYANKMSITPKYLNTIVQNIAHTTPKKLIDQYVILQLKLHLRTCDMNIKQIAWEYKFSDESFFCRYFKQHTGITPQQFRKTNTK